MFGHGTQTVFVPLATGGFAVYEVTYKGYTPAGGNATVLATSTSAVAEGEPVAVTTVESKVGLPDSYAGLSDGQKDMIPQGPYVFVTANSGALSHIVATDPRIYIISFDLEIYRAESRSTGAFPGKTSEALVKEYFPDSTHVGPNAAGRWGLGEAMLRSTIRDTKRKKFAVYSAAGKDRYKLFDDKKLWSIDLGMGITLVMGDTKALPMLNGTVAAIPRAKHISNMRFGKKQK